MKSQRLFAGIILIGYGCFFLIQQLQVESLQSLLTWPILLAITGLAFLIQAYSGKEYNAIFPGVILFGFGLHFIIVDRLSIWPNHIGAFVLIIALAFLLYYLKTGNGLLQGFLMLVLAITLLFYEKILQYAGNYGEIVSYITKFWPAIFIIIGLFFLIKRK
ncbi:LiaI-LiaF-like domain-containing protein [Cytobacillus kochii]|uniref:LiaI-LiaF-like domain-containing protein n=1 Tax=Cytobacillus kochii TaxID=859143 RepID=UPI0025A1FE79|nr:DUF5668 domain-containing protein [Cytobacillus kochii]MDM5208675.1 DUF5668 domain-containing protein [Cytobacillus kochii]